MTDSAQNIQDPDHGFLRIQKNLTDRTSYSTLFRNLWLENLVVANTHGCLKSRTSLKVTSVLCRSTGDMRAVSYIWAPTRAMQNMAKRRESPVSWNTILKNERAICFQIQNPLFDIQVLYCTVQLWRSTSYSRVKNRCLSLKYNRAGGPDSGEESRQAGLAGCTYLLPGSRHSHCNL